MSLRMPETISRSKRLVHTMSTELVDDVYEITCAETPNGHIRAYLVDGTHPTLFDCGLPDSTEALIEGIDATAITPERLVITHTDQDHIGGIDAVIEEYGVETYLPVGSELAGERADTVYSEGDEISGFVALHMPGHRSHQHVLVNETREIAVLGDAVSGADQRGLPAGYFHLPPGMYSEDLILAEESLGKLLDYEFEVGLVYHGSSVTENARDTLEAYVGGFVD